MFIPNFSIVNNYYVITCLIKYSKIKLQKTEQKKSIIILFDDSSIKI